jgi:hypothetical protein
LGVIDRGQHADVLRATLLAIDAEIHAKVCAECCELIAKPMGKGGPRSRLHRLASGPLDVSGVPVRKRVVGRRLELFVSGRDYSPQ